MVDTLEPRPTTALWRTLARLDKSKINTWIAFRNGLGVALPLGIGIALGKPLGVVAIATGALNVSYSDDSDPYAQRARRMLAWSVLGAVSVFIGSVTGKYHWAAIVAAAVWGFVAEMLVSISSRAGDLGLNTLVTLIVFAPRGALSPVNALIAALLVLAGGLLQTCLSLILWPIRRRAPERQALAQLDLSRSAEPGITAERLGCLSSILAHSHALMHSMMASEAGVTGLKTSNPPPELRAFAHDVDFTLYFLAAALRGSSAASQTLPKLREDHTRLL